MKKVIIILSLGILAVAIISSCTKTSQPATPYSNLYGRWKIVQEAFDDTNTGKLDSNQVSNLAANDIESIQFNKDSTGTHYITFNGAKEDYNFKWTLIDNYAEIQMITSGGDTLVSRIESLYSSTLTLMNYTNPQLSWYILKKQ
ncbi:MAG: lipocalin family protein [Flavipsychrobacter sp.]|nr:lipocalin family protein [Flavipsychrobacter sp.]